MAEQEQDRSEKATPFKLQEARKRGTVAKSPDAVAVAVLAAAAVFVYAMGWTTVRRELALDMHVLASAGRLPFDIDSIFAWLSSLLLQALLLLLPLFLAVAIVAIVANMAQTGGVFSAKPLAPDFERLSPAAGFKRVFSFRTLYDALRSLFKLGAVGTVLGLSLWHLVPWLLALLQFDPVGYAHPVLERLGGVVFRLVLAMLAIALVDLVYTRWEFARRMRMSRRELRDEVKQREGDPRIRARLRQLRAEMLKSSRALRKLPSADVVVTNPTHLAVAISYRHGEMPAPLVVAKGAGELAGRMREIARRHGIPVVENRALARELFFKVDYDAAVPESVYPQVAKILVWVYAMRKARAAPGAA
jgi:flagellar biosynthetic protein FlhB